MGKARDLSEFERGMIVGARSAGCSISETVRRLGFSKTAVSRVYREWCEKRKTSSHRGSCGRKRLVDESGERTMEKVVEANVQATSEQIQALYNSSAPEKPISLTTTRRTLKRLGYSRKTQRREQRDSLIVAGLEALAVYASRPPQTERVRCDPDSKSHSSTDGAVREDDAGVRNEPDPKIQSSTDEAFKNQCQTQSYTGVMFQAGLGDRRGQDPQFSRNVAFKDQCDPKCKTQSTTSVAFVVPKAGYRDEHGPELNTSSSTNAVFKDHAAQLSKSQTCTDVMFEDPGGPDSKTQTCTGAVLTSQKVLLNWK